MVPSSYRDEFPLKDGLIYLNHAAVSPLPQRTANAIKAFAEDNLYHGSSNYLKWLEVEKQLKQQGQSLIQCESSDDIALLKNTSEGLSIIAYGIDWQKGENIVIPNCEFPSNRVVWESLKRYGVEVRLIDLDQTESPEFALIEQCDEHTRLISVSAVQYASGLRMDLPKLGQFCHLNEILFCVDAIQQLGALPFDNRAVLADFIVADGHKWMMGPEGIALFYCNPRIRDKLILRQFGWHMVEHHMDYDRMEWQPANTARRFECGSPNMLGIHALQASLSLLLELGDKTIAEAILSNTNTLINLINDNPLLELSSDSQEGRISGIITFCHKEKSPQKVYNSLIEHGVSCACRGKGVRFSPHFYNTEDELIEAVELATV